MASERGSEPIAMHVIQIQELLTQSWRICTREWSGPGTNEPLKVLDMDGSGTINFEEFLQGTLRCQGVET